MTITLLLVWQAMALNLIPQYQSNTDSSCSSVSFSTSFSVIPTVIIWIHYEDHTYGTTKYLVQVTSVSKTGFSYNCQNLVNTGGTEIAWFAYVDENIHYVSNTITTVPSSLSITFPIPQTTIPAAAFLISGKGIVTGNSFMNYVITVDPATLTSVTVHLNPGSGFQLNYLVYTLIYASTDFFSAGEMGGTSGSCFLAQPKLTNFPIQAYQVLSTINSDNIRVYSTTSGCSTGQVKIVTFSVTSISSWTLTYFQYSPCPYYCTTCSASVYPNCDSCKAGTFRTSSDCSQCQLGYYPINGQLICATCLSYCQGCSGSASGCTACNPATQRLLSPGPACSTCPASYFVQTGLDNCQQCASYCQTCVTSKVTCTACLTGSNRILDGNCTICPINMYVLVGVDNCQVCKGYCNGCINISTTCLACQSSTFRLYAPNCTTCPAQMFIQSGVDTCQTCSTICNNCSITSTNCTSCLVSTQRLYPPNCQTCPSNMFIQIGQDNCQQCNSICNQCTVSANNCTACNGLYRTNAPNCNQCTQPNYYIDSSFIDCQPCESYCNGCVTSSTNCIACWPFTFQQFAPYCESCPTTQFILNTLLCNVNLSQLICSSNYNRDFICNCLTGYYNDQNFLSCLKCSNICQTCTGSATNCLICNSNLFIFYPPICGTCIDGYYMLYGNCTQCSNICQTCTQSSGNCLTCPLPRMNPPQCTCPDGMQSIFDLGYFNNCSQSCSSKCLTCSGTSDNCLVCSGNRTNPPICGCSDGSVQSSAICSSIMNLIIDCSIASPIARFSDDLNQILIIFEFELNSGINCNNLLTQSTIIAMGTNYNCQINENVLILILGTQATISIFQPIFINPNQLQFNSCNSSIENIITPIIQMPHSPQPPQIQFESSQFTTTQCDAVNINIVGFQNNGQRNLQLQKWTIIQANNYIHMKKLIDKWNSQPLMNFYMINPQYLNGQTQIELMIQFSNFIGLQSNQTIYLNIQQQTLQLQAYVPNQFYIFDTPQFIFTPFLLQCRQSLYNPLVSLSVIISNQTKKLTYNYQVEAETQTIISFNPSELSLYSTYDIQASATLNQLGVQIEKSVTIIPFNFTVNIQGGDQQIGINQKMSLSLDIFDPNIQNQDLNLTEYNITWLCTNIIKSSPCTGFSYSKQDAVVNTSSQQPYTTLQVQASVQKNLTIVNTMISVLVLQDLVNQIKIQGNSYELNTPMNFYDHVDVSIFYKSDISFDIDQLTYKAMYLDSTYSQNIIEFKSTQTSIEINNFEKSQLTGTAKYKVLITHPSQSYPSVATQTIKINIPPQGCQLSVFIWGPKYILQINNCVSQQQPLQYQFIYYQSKDDLIYDNDTGTINKGTQLTNFSIQPTFVTYLIGSNSTWILGIIRDQSNGLANVSMNFQETQIIDQHILKNMLFDNNINLPRNIYFMLQYAQTNNQTITQTYLNQINQILHGLNLSDPINLKIQQKLISQQSLSNDEIINQFIIQSNQINSISTQLYNLQTQHQKGVYNKDYNIRLLLLEAQLLASTNHISFLYEQSQQTSNRRILTDQVQNITQYLTSTVQNITDIIGNLTKINAKQKTIQTPQFNLSAQKFSTSNINNNFGIQIINQTNQTVSFKNQQYSVNPYQNQSDFANPVKAPLIVPNLTDVNSVQIQPANPIPIRFPLIGDFNISCASKIGNSWSLDVCTPVKSTTTIECLCQSLSPLSIVQALEFILSQFGYLFASTIKEKISNFPYYEVIYTYLVLIFILGFFVAKCLLHRQDANDATKIYPAPDIQKVQQQELQSRDDQKINYKVLNITSIKDLDAQETFYTYNSLIGDILNKKITKQQGFYKFLQNSHILFELYYRYDEQDPRILRLNILFLQILGQICIFVLFGKNLAISIVIGLSIFQTAYGILFQLILSKMIKSKNKYLNIAGLFIAICLTGLCTYLIIAAMSLYTDVYSANIAALSYLASFFLDYFITSITVELLKYIFIMKTCQSQKYKVQSNFKQKIYEILLSPGLQQILFGRKLQQSNTQTKL